MLDNDAAFAMLVSMLARAKRRRGPNELLAIPPLCADRERWMGMGGRAWHAALVMMLRRSRRRRNSRRDECDGGGGCVCLLYGVLVVTGSTHTRDHLTRCVCRWSVGRAREGPDGVDQMGYSCIGQRGPGRIDVHKAYWLLPCGGAII